MVALSKNKAAAHSCGLGLSPTLDPLSWRAWWQDLSRLITGKAAPGGIDSELWAEETARSRRTVSKLTTCGDRGPEGAAWLLNEHAGHDGVQDPSQPPQTHFEVRRRLQKRWIEELRSGGPQEQDEFVKQRAAQVPDASVMESLDLQVEVTLQALVRGELPGINKTFDAGDTGGSGDSPAEAAYQLLPMDWVRLSEAYQVDFVLHGLPGTEGQMCHRCGAAGHIHTGSEASGGNYLCLHVGYNRTAGWEPLGAGPISVASAAVQSDGGAASQNTTVQGGSATSEDRAGSAATLAAAAEANEASMRPLSLSDTEGGPASSAGWERCVRVFGDGLTGGPGCRAACKAVCTDSTPWVGCLNKGLAFGCMQTLDFCPEKVGAPAVCESEIKETLAKEISTGEQPQRSKELDDTTPQDTSETADEIIELKYSGSSEVQAMVTNIQFSPGSKVTGIGARLCVFFDGLTLAPQGPDGEVSTEENAFKITFVKAVAKAGGISEDRVRILEVGKPLDAEHPARKPKQPTDTGGGVLMFLEPEDTADESPDLDEEQSKESGIRVLAVIRESNGDSDESSSAMQALDKVHAEVMDPNSALHDAMFHVAKGHKGRLWGPDVNNVRAISGLRQSPRARRQQVPQPGPGEFPSLQPKSSKEPQEPRSPAASI